MKTNISWIFLLYVFITLWGCADSDAPIPTDYPSQLEERSFNSPALAGNLFGDPSERKMPVYTPEGYNPAEDKRYPVYYLLHGLPSSDSSLVSPAVWAQCAPTEHPDFPAEGFQASY